MRFPQPGDARGGWQKEWYHFCIMAPEVDVVVNLNVAGDMRPAARPGSRVARVIVLARERQWGGDLETIAERQIELLPGEVWMRLGQNRLRFSDGRFSLVAALQGRPLVVEATLEPQTMPLALGREVRVGLGSIDWFVLPRLSASGRVISGGRLHEFDGAPAYHDHNWGRWLWGHDFCWEWGFAHFEVAGEPWSLVYDRTLNRPRTHALELTLAVWRGSQLARIFSRREVGVGQSGYVDNGRPLRVPRPLAIAVPAAGGDVPRRLEVSAAVDGDRLRLTVELDDYAQILVPHETDLGTTVISEAAGRVRVEGLIRGSRIDASGRGIFEFLAA